jgi:parallel beta-helix repeat protein
MVETAGRRRKGIQKLVALLVVAAFMNSAVLAILVSTDKDIIYDPVEVGAIPPLPMPGYGSMHPGTVPHYFGPYANWANSPVPKGAITSLTLASGGTGYSSPTVSLMDAFGTGSGATATASVEDGVITGLNLTNGGSGYSAPVVIITDATGSGAAASADIGGVLTGGIRKFIDTLPGLTPAGANNLGNYIPVAVADTTTYPGCDYYEIAVVKYTQKMHTDLPLTLLLGYVQLETAANYAVSKHIVLKNPNNTNILLANGTQAVGVDKPFYLGPTIVAQRDVPVRIKFCNLLPTGSGGDLFLPVDKTVMGSGMGPLDKIGQPGMKENYTDNRATLHLHGGATPWISDGTPDQWTTPAGENTQYPKGVSVAYVPDMWFVNGSVIPNTVGQTTPPTGGASNNPGNGTLTFYYTNQQSARLMFYHDHAYGITRLNVYAGEAAGYLLTDNVEKELIASGILPDAGGIYTFGIPLVIQDKTFVDASTIAYQDPTWAWGSNSSHPVTGDIWMPHVYMTNQNAYAPDGANALGRWDYGPWFFPPTNNILQGVVPNPYYDPVNAPWEPPYIPGVPNVSMAMEAYSDTPLVNGQAYPYIDLNPQAYRFRILNAANDRFFNLQLYVADPNVLSSDGRANTDVKMVTASPTPGYPPLWPTDGRVGGVPDPATMGPSIIQIGTEGGFLPAPVVIPNQPVTWNYNPKTFHFGDVQDHALFLGTAERADVVIDFSKYAGKTLILYNDAPAAVPAADPRNDYYTGDGDQTDSGGAPNTQPGFGPNTRTVMQIRVANNTPAASYNLNALNAAFAKTPTKKSVFEMSQDPIIVPEARYNSAYGKSFPADTYVRIGDENFTFTTLGNNTLTLDFEHKGIHEEMGGAYNPIDGRMSAILGLEIPKAGAITQTFIGFSYDSPPVDFLSDSMTPMSPVAADGTQIWRISHNGVDTHTIHWHLVNVQLINRVAWDNTIIPPDDNELGWKETVRVNPLMDTIVAIRAVAPTLPFEIPDSVRALQPSEPLGDVLTGTGGGMMDIAGNAISVTNHLVNFGWEYVYHCHILGHEEMDMMHAVPFAVAPSAPTGLDATSDGTTAALNWTDNSITESKFIVQTATASSGPWTTLANISSPYNTTGKTKGTVFYYNDTLGGSPPYYYQVLANKIIGDTTDYGTGVHFPTVSSNSTPPYILRINGVTVSTVAVPGITPYQTPAYLYSAGNTTTRPATRPGFVPPTGLTTHAPIRINSNADFIGANGVSAGAGTSGNPWIIENWAINASGKSYGIYVGNTSDYFVIRNCYIHDAVRGTFSFPYAPESAIVFNNVDRGTASGNTLYSNGFSGVYAAQSQNLVLTQNNIVCSYYAIYFCATDNSAVSFNNLTSNNAGMWIDPSNGNTIANNTVMNGIIGIALAASSGSTVTGNTLLSNAQGFFLTMSSGNTLHSNNVISNLGQAYDDGANSWDNGYPAGGNHWSDYTGVDANSGVNQNIPGSDGIGDKHYNSTTGQGITGGSNVDRYPVMIALDIVPPVSTVNAINPYWGRTSPLVINVTATDPLSGVRDVTLEYRYSANNVTFGAWTTFLKKTSPPWQFSFNFPSGQGHYEFEANGSDRANNAEVLTGSAEARCGHDTAAPSSSVNTITPYLQNSMPLTVTAAASDAMSGLNSVTLYYASSLDNVSWPAISAYTMYGQDTGAPWSWSFTYPNGAGFYRYYTISDDIAGNVESLPGSFDAMSQYNGFDHIEVTPATLNAFIGMQYQFTAIGKDVFNNTITGLNFVWTTNVGTVNGTGLFTAQNTPGPTGFVNATVGGKIGTANVTIIPNTLTRIAVTPSPVNVTAGGTQAFSATGYDQNNNPVAGPIFVWTTNVGTMAGNVLTAQTSSGVTGYVRATVGVASGDAVVTIVPQGINHIDMSPLSLVAIAGMQYQFTATGRDIANNAIPGVVFSWTCTAGSVTGAGLFTAPTAAGTSVYVNATNGTTVGSSTVTVVPDQLNHIIVTPASASVAAGALQAFSATGYDQYGNTIPGLFFNWSTSVGSMSGSSLVAQTTAGAVGYVRATIGPVSGESIVIIIPASLDHIDMTPPGLVATAGMKYQFTATGRDNYNNIIPGLTFNWTATIGTVISGLYTAPTLAGATGYVNATIGVVTGTAIVSTIPDQLTLIRVTPTPVNVTAGAVQAFSATGYDQYSNLIPGLSFNWSTIVGTMTGSSLNAQTIAGVVGYVRATIGLVSGDAIVTIVPGALHHIDMTPPGLVATAGKQYQFNATGRDVYDNAIPGLSFNWTRTIGAVTSAGLFTAPTIVGPAGYVNATIGVITGTAMVSIIPDQLTVIRVTPSPVSVTAGTVQVFSATGYDQYNNLIPGLSFNWTTNVGTMTGSSLTAQTIAIVTGYVRATIGLVSADSVVTIVPGPLDHIDMTPPSLVATAGKQYQFTAAGKDMYNNMIPGLSFNWTTTIGTVISSGLFTAQTIANATGYVNATIGLIKGTAVVSTIPDQLTVIRVTPVSVNVPAGGIQNFSAVGYDQYNNTIPGISFNWSTIVGTMTNNSLRAQTLAGVIGYVRASIGLVTGDSDVMIVPAAIDHIDMSPGNMNATAGKQYQLTATGRDVYNNTIPWLVFNWTTTVGTVTGTGLFTAQTMAIVDGYANATVGATTGTVRVVVIPDQLTAIRVTPAMVNVSAGGVQNFSAVGYDQYNNTILGLSFNWSTTVGTMTNNSLTAQTLAGSQGEVQATIGLVIGDSVVTMVPAELDHIDMLPASLVATAGMQYHFIGIPNDIYNNNISGLVLTWSTTVGIISSSGLFTAQTLAGASGTVTASVGGKTGTAPVNIIPDQLTDIRVTPPSTDVPAGGVKAFSALGYDQYNNLIPGLAFNWTTDVGTMAGSSLTAQTIAGAVGYARATIGPVTDDSVVTIVPAALDHVDVSPPSLVAVAGKQYAFMATPKDVYNNTISGQTITWATTVGTVTGAGQYTTQTAANTTGIVSASVGGKTGTAQVRIIPDQLTHILVLPATINVTAGGVQDFSAAGYDQYNNIIPGLAFNWSTDIGTMSAGSLTAQTTAGATGYARATIGPVSGDAAVTVLPEALDHIVISPSSMIAVAGMSYQFTAAGKDIYENIVPGLIFTWTTTAGNITISGLFTAQTTAGTEGTVMASTGGKTGTAAVSTIPNQLTNIRVTPVSVNVSAGTVQAFSAQGYDQYNNSIAGLTFNWTANVGAMAGSSLTAQNIAGVTGYVRATIGLVSGDSDVTVVPSPLDHIDVSPANLNATAGMQYQFTAIGRDRYNNSIPGLNYSWNTTVGNITGAGMLSAQTKAGKAGLVGASVGGKTQTAAVVIIPDQLVTITVTPDLLNVSTKGTQVFSAIGYDQYGNPIPGLTFNWTTNAGAISTNGSFVAQKKGLSGGHVRAGIGLVDGQSNVRVVQASSASNNLGAVALYGGMLILAVILAVIITALVVGRMMNDHRLKPVVSIRSEPLGFHRLKAVVSSRMKKPPAKGKPGGNGGTKKVKTVKK